MSNTTNIIGFVNDKENFFLVLLCALVLIDVIICVCLCAIMYFEIRAANERRAMILQRLQEPHINEIATGIPITI